MMKKKQKQIVESFVKDTAAVKECLNLLAQNHDQNLSESEKETFKVIDQYLSNVDTFFQGYKKGLKGA